MDLGLDPVIVRLGPLAIRWYGVLMATSVLIGFYYLRRGVVKLGYHEDFAYNLALITVVGGIAGARFIYVATNWAAYAGRPVAWFLINQGGLSFHGGLLGGLLFGGTYVWVKRARFRALADLVVPGLCVGIMLVRIGNLINGEVLGRMTQLGFGRHPAQLYGSAIGLVLLVIHNVLARRQPPAGYLFWSFILYYSILRGVVEETFRANPLYALGYVNDTYGIGFFTLTHLVTPFLVVLAWYMRKRTRREPAR